MFQCGDVPVRRRWKCVPMSGGRAHSPWSETELCVKVVNSHVLVCGSALTEWRGLSSGLVASNTTHRPP